MDKEKLEHIISEVVFRETKTLPDTYGRKPHWMRVTQKFFQVSIYLRETKNISQWTQFSKSPSSLTSRCETFGSILEGRGGKEVIIL